MQKMIDYFLKNPMLANWLMLLLFIAGGFGLMNMQMRIWPKMELNSININIPFPGASALEVEEGLITKIEERLRGVEGIDRMVSTSMDNYGTIWIQIDQQMDMRRALDLVRNTVNSLPGYPVGAEKPVIYQNTQWNRSQLITIYGTDDLMALKAVTEEFRDELLKTGKISQINTWGLPDREIVVEVSPQNLIRYGLTIRDISNAINASSLNIASGSIVTQEEEILLRSYERKYTANELETIPLVTRLDGQTVLLRDIADIREQWPDNTFYTEVNGQRSVGFNVMYNDNEDVLEIAKVTDQKIEEFNERYEGLITFEPFIRDVDELHERLGTLSVNGLIGLVMVVLVLGFFLNIRLSFWVALGIPISFAGLFFVQWLLGITINQMSLFGLIMVIGILVDDAIIIGEAIYREWKENDKPALQAALDGTLDVIQPVMISIATTVVAFTPYFYMYGELGKFVWQIGAVVIIGILFSLIEALIILPVHLAHSKALQHSETPSHALPARIRRGIDFSIAWFVEKVYQPLLKFSLRYRWSVIALMFTMILVVAGAFKGTHIRAQFFPELESHYARITVEIPSGTSAAKAELLRDRLIQKALDFGKTWAIPEKNYENAIQNHVSWMGGTTMNIFLVMIPNKDRDFTLLEFSNALAEYIGSVPEAENINIGSAGSFGGSPISVRFLSADYHQLMRAKELFKAELKKLDGVKDIQDDTPLGAKEYQISLKPKAAALGLSLHDVTSQLRQGFYGHEVTRIQRNRDEIKIWVRYPLKERSQLSQIENLMIRTPLGAYIPFSEIADASLGRGVKQIRHEDGYRSIRVFANLDFSKNDLNVVLREINEEIVPRVLSQVENVSKSASGQSQEVQLMIKSMSFTMALALVVIFTILLFLMKSYLQTLLVITLIPLGFIGAILGHMIIGIPVSFISFLGSIALGGIIINDSVVLVDRYNKKKYRDYLSPAEAALEAGMVRFRPIIMTTITTAAGLAPLIFEKSEGGQFLVPMAVSVAFGLIFGTFITLFMLPSALVAIEDLKNIGKRTSQRLENL
jgi:multidrug efflux pump subunit AcrB